MGGVSEDVLYSSLLRLGGLVSEPQRAQPLQERLQARPQPELGRNRQHVERHLSFRGRQLVSSLSSNNCWRSFFF